MLSPGVRLGAVHDPAEREADRIAGAVTGAGPRAAPPPAGGPLDPPTRSFFEQRLGAGLGDVRVHAGATAAASARALGARAYAVGRDVVFGAGEYQPGTPSGARLLAHELAHVVQQRAGPAIARRQPVQAPACSVREPQHCVTYEQWLSQFAALPTFAARDTAPGGAAATGSRVIGDVAAEQEPGGRPERAPPVPATRGADRFIDHPTDAWVRANLPANLRETAYLLPSDCADVPVILRHVWLAAHGREETYRGWRVGDVRGGPRREAIRAIIGDVYSGNVDAVVNAYADESGSRIRSFAALRHLLHPGDVLVWIHQTVSRGRRTGGHTQTVTEVVRDGSGAVTAVRVVQGNQPIFAEQAGEIRAFVGRGAPSESQLRNAPGRRLEAESLSGSELRDTDQPSGPRGETQPVWTMDADTEEITLLVAAGPPAAAARPRVRRGRVRSLRDWLGSLAAASLRTLDGVVEAALLELRGWLEGGRAVAEDEARAFGEAAGTRLWDLARAARDLGAASHFEPLTRLRAVIAAVRGAARVPAAARVFDALEDAFAFAARGAATIGFRRAVGRGVRLVRVLVTGFDPFEPSGSLTRPAPGTWNPSAAAALAVDGRTVNAGRGARAAIESVVLPVSFREFAAGLVERIVGPRRGELDAVVTVSMDAGLDPAQGVRLERYAVGAHDVGRGRLEAIPPAPGEPIGPAIIESTADVEALAADARVRGPRPTVGRDVTLRFADLAAARGALTALGLPAPASRDAVIADPAAIAEIIRTATQPDRTRAHRIRFRAGGRDHAADVISGPGGDFLSNEVSYRMLRSLAQASGQPLPASFHVHTQRGDPIPQAPGRDQRRALETARGLRTRLIATILGLVGALARRIAGRP